MRSRRAPKIALLCATLAAFAAAGAAASDQATPKRAPKVVAKSVAQDPALVRSYWTAERMREALPIQLGSEARMGHVPAKRGEPSRVLARADDVSGASASTERVHGKVFLTLDRDYVCSATVVTSPSHTLVWTAGHCVHGADIDLGFARNWMFVPGYNRGQRPYGSWTAASLQTTHEWAQEANIRTDLGAAVLARDAEGRGIEDVVGARGIAFNQTRNQIFDAFGYPAVDTNTFLLPPNYDGQSLWRCHSPRTADDSPSGSVGPDTMEINCDMTGGSSGGGWVTADGLVNSVTSYGYELDSGHLYGPYMGASAEDLYRRAGGGGALCAKRPATNLGGAADDDYAGTNGADSFVLLGGNDRSSGGGSADHACGGAGNDRLVGGAKADVLQGGRGNDILIGGPGADICVGGPGRDRAIGCAERLKIP